MSDEEVPLRDEILNDVLFQIVNLFQNVNNALGDLEREIDELREGVVWKIDKLEKELNELKQVKTPKTKAIKKGKKKMKTLFHLFQSRLIRSVNSSDLTPSVSGQPVQT